MQWLGKAGSSWKALGFALCLSAAGAHADPLTLGGDSRVDPEQFRITTFASGLDYPTSMLTLADGSLLVATSRPASSSFFNSTGELLRFVDGDGDGVADGPATVLYSGLPGAVTSLRQAADLFLVVSAEPGGEQIALLRSGATPSDPMSFVGGISLGFPSDWQHRTVALAVRDDPEMSSRYEVFFNVGSRANQVKTVDTVSASGLVTADLQADSIYRATVHDGPGGPEVTNLTQIAAGLRNAAGMAFHPISGDLFLQDNGIDGAGGEQVSADELNQIPVDELGGAIEDFGFAANYVEYRTSNVIGGSGIQPLIAFQPVPDPLTGSRSEGAFEITFAPPNFPAGLNDGLFVGFHGQFSAGGLNNTENPLVYVDLETGAYFHFVGVDEAAVGHLDGLLATDDSLFVSDLTAAGSLSTGGGAGVIYQIQAVNDPVLLLGDANNDGLVTGLDLIAVQENFANIGPPDDGTLPGDANDDGLVTGADLIAVQENFGKAAAVVPEPVAVALLGLGVGFFPRLRR